MMYYLGLGIFWWSVLSLISTLSRFSRIKVNNNLWKIKDKKTGEEWLTNDYWITKLTDSVDLPPE